MTFSIITFLCWKSTAIITSKLVYCSKCYTDGTWEVKTKALSQIVSLKMRNAKRRRRKKSKRKIQHDRYLCSTHPRCQQISYTCRVEIWYILNQFWGTYRLKIFDKYFFLTLKKDFWQRHLKKHFWQITIWF